MGLRRFKTWWLYVATGLVALISGWSGITLSLNRTLVPQLFTDAVPDLDLNTPPLIASCTIALVALVFLVLNTVTFYTLLSGMLAAACPEGWLADKKSLAVLNSDPTDVTVNELTTVCFHPLFHCMVTTC